MKLNICALLPLLYSPDMRVNPQIGIFSYLSKFGHRITWLMSSENSRTAQQLFHEDISVCTAPYIHYLSDSFLIGKVFNQIPAAFRKMCLTLRVFCDNKAHYDIIFVRDGTVDGLVASYIQARYNIPFVYELTDPLEQEWKVNKVEAKKPLFFWYLMAMVKTYLKMRVMKKADLILVTTRWFDEALIKRDIPKEILMPFPNGVDLESFSGRGGKDIRDRYGMGSATVIVYIGTMAKVRKLDVLLRAFQLVKHMEENVKLLMIGEGTGKNDLERLAVTLGLEKEVIFTGQVLQSEVPRYITAADIGISPVPPVSFYVVSSPIKLLEYMAMGKPVVANEEIMEHKEVIEESGGGITVPFQDKAFADAIIELIDNPEKAGEMGRRGAEWVVKNRSYEVLARRLEARLLELLRNKQRS